MAVEYDLYQTPAPKGGKKVKGLHARVANAATVSMKDLAKRIENGTTISRADMLAVIVEMGRAFIDELSRGNRLHIEGVGYFQMTLSCPSDVEKASDIRAESIAFKSISFAPEKELKRQLKGTSFVRSTRSSHSENHSDTELTEILTDYFKSHAYITRLEFERACNMTRSTAYRKIKTLVEQKQLVRDYKADLYLPAQGCFE